MNQGYSDQDIRSHFERAVQLQQNNQLNDAESIYRKILEINSDHIGAQTMLGMVCIQTNRNQDGIQLLETSLLKDPQQFWAHNSLGVGFLNVHQYQNACTSFNKAISIEPNFIEAYFNLAKGLKSLEKYEEAISNYSKCILLNPNYADAYNNRGSLYLENLQEPEKALIDFQNFLKIQPNVWNSFYNIANCYSELKEYEEAIKHYDLALELNPNNAEIYFLRGVTYFELERYEEALQNYDRALELSPHQANVYSNKAVVYKSLKQHENALKNIEYAIKLNPDLAAAYYNRGLIFLELKQYQEADESYNRAIKLEPNKGDAYWNKSNLKILQGCYEEGWQLFEWRWKTTFLNLQPRNFKQPLWLGRESIANKIILIHHEQGLGDSIQFSRYISFLEKYNPKEIILEAPQALISVLSSLRGNFKVIKLGDPLPHFDYYCPIMSLPLAFKTTLESIPSEMPYLYADKNKNLLWEKKLGDKIKPRVGLVWSGFKGHKNDRNRSLLLKQLESIFSLPFEFHSLQKEIRDNDLEVLNSYNQIRQHQDDLIDFSNTAALIHHLDLIISVDTSVAHLAGALGKKVFLMLPYAPDYRWMDQRTDTPWYPTMTLFRQPKADDWTSVVSELCIEIKNFFSH
jgi:tetratricopeptide (TPR) repeat protein